MDTKTIDLPHLGPRATAGEVVEAIRESDAVIVDDVLSRAQLRCIESELGPYLDATSYGRDGFSGHRTKRVGALIARSPTCRELALHPLVNAACAEFLAPHCEGYQLHFTQAVSIARNEGEQPLHRDRGVWGGRVHRSIEPQFSTIWALSDFSEENGATRVVPGSSRWDKHRVPEAHEVCHASMRAGSVLLYTGSVIHGGGANRTDHDRVGVLLHYALNWLRQEENQYLSCPPHVAKELSRELRALMGYSSTPLMGFCSPPLPPGECGEMVSPETLFRKVAGRWPGL